MARGNETSGVGLEFFAACCGSASDRGDAGVVTEPGHTFSDAHGCGGGGDGGFPFTACGDGIEAPLVVSLVGLGLHK